MLLVGYEYGTNYLGAPVLGLFVWCVVCFALNTLLDWLYEKTGCIWVPSIAHGAFNAVAALFVVLTNPADSYYNVLGPAPIGLIGMLPMLAAAGALGGGWYYLYGVLLLCAMLGTALSCAVALRHYCMVRFSTMANRRFSFVLLLAIPAWLCSLFGFVKLIGTVYPICGALGALALLGLLHHRFTLRAPK